MRREYNNLFREAIVQNNYTRGFPRLFFFLSYLFSCFQFLSFFLSSLFNPGRTSSRLSRKSPLSSKFRSRNRTLRRPCSMEKRVSKNGGRGALYSLRRCLGYSRVLKNWDLLLQGIDTTCTTSWLPRPYTKLSGQDEHDRFLLVGSISLTPTKRGDILSTNPTRAVSLASKVIGRTGQIWKIRDYHWFIMKRKQSPLPTLG